MIAEPASESRVERGPGTPVDASADGDAIPDSLVRFAAGIAHDFNNLLTVINGYGELILEGYSDPEGCRWYVRQIVEAGAKAARIVDLILAYAGAPAPSSGIFDVNHVVEEMGPSLVRSLGESVSLNLRVCGEPAPVKGDRGRFEWALLSLAMNAKDAMPGGGRLELETRAIPVGEPGGFGMDVRRARLELSIRDNGCGMAKEDLARAFEPYFSTKRKSNVYGTGLGLASVRGIVRQMRGCIVAESEPGKGALFRICLPLADAERP